MIHLRRSPLLSLLLALLLTLGCWAETPPAQTLSTALDEVTARAVTDRRVAGCVVLVYHNGVPVYAQAAGLADIESGRPMKTDALFRLASVSKPIVSAGAMRLVQDGRMKLDTPLDQWLPDFRPSLADGNSPSITVEQLLTHTSGLSYRFSEPKESLYHALGVSDGVDNPTLTLEENLARLSRAPLAHSPGSAFRYGLSTDVLGAVMEKVTHQDLPDAMESLVLGPLAMNDTGFYAKDPGRLATPYGNTKAGLVRIVDGTTLALGEGMVSYGPSKALQATDYPSAGGGMVGSAGDFARFLEVIRKGGAPVLARSTVALMTRNQLGEVKGHRAGWGFGYGWAVLLDPVAAKTPQSVGTLQWGGAYGHSWFVDPQEKLTVVVFTNTAFEGMIGKLPIEVRDAVYQWVRQSVNEGGPGRRDGSRPR